MMKKLLSLLFSSIFFILCFLIGLTSEVFIDYQLVLVSCLAFIAIFIWLNRNDEDGIYRILKATHQSNLDDIEQQQLEEPVDEFVVKEQISNSVAAVNIFWFTLLLAICCVTFLIGQESIGVVDWLIVLSIIAAPLILAFFYGEWFVDIDDKELQELEEQEAKVI